jgi:hypothetical protein
MKKIVLIALLSIGFGSNAQTSDSLVSYQHKELYHYADSKGWVKARTHYVQTTFIFNKLQRYIKVVNKTDNSIHNHQLIYSTNEDGDEVIYSNFMGVEYKWVFPFKDSKSLLIYTVEKNGVKLELSQYYIK